MKLKKLALKGLIILFVVISLCMFFGKTVQTITTAKVNIVRGTTGRFEEKIQLTAKVHFQEVVEYTIEEATKSPLTVDKVFVKPGHWVEKGDVIFTARMPSFDTDMEKLRKDYDEQSKALIDLDIPNRKLSKQSAQNDLYEAMLAAQDSLSEATFKARSLAQENGLVFVGEVSSWSKQLNIAEDMPELVRNAAQKAIAAKKTFDDARTAFFNTYENRKLKVSKDTFDYINKRNEIIKKMDEINEEIVSLEKRYKDLTRVIASQAGYVVALEVVAGEAYDGAKTAYSLSKEETEPILRAEIPSDMKRVIENGTRVEIPIGEYEKERTTIENTYLAPDGTKYLEITLPEAMQGGKSSAIRTMIADEGVNLTITYRAKQANTQLPASCVRQDGDASYVFVIEKQYGGFMSASGMKVKKQTVTVLDKSDKWVSVADSLEWQDIADNEDRPLTDGQTVMQYVN